jgi:phosphoribosylanthranilate isomerase
MKRLTIKVCARREAENIRAVARLDTDRTGFIFYPASPRCLPDGEACATLIRQHTKTKVGMFVCAGAEEINEPSTGGLA